MFRITVAPLLIGGLLVAKCDGFQQKQPMSSSSSSGGQNHYATVEHIGVRLQLLLAKASPALAAHGTNKKGNCDPCQEIPSKDLTLDRREAAFAMLGTIWAAGAVPTALLFPEAARATYGTDAKIQLPNPIESLTDRATKQCLVESLGTRECLVYAGDADSMLYKGADTQLLLQRIEQAASALATIPVLAVDKKWSQVTGILTGRMGELIKTMGQLADLSANSDAAKVKVKAMKTSLYAMSAAVDRKDQTTLLKSHAVATNELVAFVKSL
jgi:hypothetical protein